MEPNVSIQKQFRNSYPTQTRNMTGNISRAVTGFVFIKEEGSKKNMAWCWVRVWEESEKHRSYSRRTRHSDCSADRPVAIMEELSFNVDHGYLEGLVRGMKAGILTQSDYHNLAQCDTLEGEHWAASSSRPRIHSLIALSYEYEALISGWSTRTEAGVWLPLSLAGESWTVGLKVVQMGFRFRQDKGQISESSLMWVWQTGSPLWPPGWIYDVALG